MKRPLIASILSLFALGLAPLPVIAWDFTSNPICSVTHQDETIRVDLTYNHATEIYAISLTKPDAPWAKSDEFSMRFEGHRPKFISTNRHEFSADGRTITAADTGFGNVLDGLQYNTLAAAIAENERIFVSLIGAYPHVEAFRKCVAALRI